MDIESGACLRTIENDMLFAIGTIKGNYKCTIGSGDNTITIWDIETSSFLQTLKGHSNFVLALEFLGNNKLASGSSDKKVKI